jgi:hypothetical protein
MAGVRSMLARVARLEAKVSPWTRLIGPIEEFEEEIRVGIAEGRYDPRDMPIVLASVKRWTHQTL